MRLNVRVRAANRNLQASVFSIHRVVEQNSASSCAILLQASVHLKGLASVRLSALANVLWSAWESAHWNEQVGALETLRECSSQIALVRWSCCMSCCSTG
jgi:hypothetical protein